MSAISFLKGHKRSEETEQVLVMEWARNHEILYPELKLLHHVPNGGKRTKQEAAILKLMGVKKGIPDLTMPVARGCYKGLYIEMKYGTNKMTVEQKEIMKKLEEQGHYVCVCYSAAAAIKVLEKYLNLFECQMLMLSSIDGRNEYDGKIQIFH